MHKLSQNVSPKLTVALASAWVYKNAKNTFLICYTICFSMWAQMCNGFFGSPLKGMKTFSVNGYAWFFRIANVLKLVFLCMNCYYCEWVVTVETFDKLLTVRRFKMVRIVPPFLRLPAKSHIHLSEASTLCPA